VGTTAESEASRGGIGGWIRAHRRGVVYALVGLACLLTLVVSMSAWVNRQLLDTDTWVDQSAEMLQDDDVRHALAVRLVDGVYSRGDVQQRLQGALPSQLDGLAPVIAGSLRPAAIDAADSLLELPAVQRLWEEANRVAHTKLVAVLEGNEGGVITTTDGDVVLDLSTLVERLRAELGLEGPGRAANAPSITIMHSDELSAAQTAVRVVKAVSVVAAIAIVALLVLAVWLAEGFRRQVVRATAWGLVAVGLILLVVRRLAGDAVVDSLANPGGEPAARQVWALSTTIMQQLGVGLIVLGLVGLLWALLAGDTRLGVRARGFLGPVLRERPAWAFGAVLLVFVLLLLWSPIGGPRGIVGTLFILLAAVAGTEALRRQALAAGPPAARPPG
jgi:hypothetical protein